MNTRLSQDAADTLQAYERQQVWRDRARRDWARANQPPCTKVWAPVLSEQERKEREAGVIRFNLPF